MNECRHEPAPRIVPALGCPLPTCIKCGIAYMADVEDDDDSTECPNPLGPIPEWVRERWQGNKPYPERSLAEKNAQAGEEATNRRAARDLAETPVRTLKQSDMQACPHTIMMPEHYRDDGSCRCNDPEHTIMAEWGYDWDGTSWIAPDDDVD